MSFPTASTSLPRTLILDYRDSYTNNLLTLFVELFTDEQVARQVVIVQADSLNWSECKQVLKEVDCVILSPGPGRPDKPEDIGYALQLIREVEIPLLGICLGLQSLAVAYGGHIINTPNLRHGHLISVRHASQGIFDFLPAEHPVEMVAYNSLTVDPAAIPDDLEVIAWAEEEVPGEQNVDSTGSIDGHKVMNGNLEVSRNETQRQSAIKTIQGLAHRTKPQWGVQFHPESIASSHGSIILGSFLDKVRTHHQTSSFPTLSASLLSRSSTAIKIPRREVAVPHESAGNLSLGPLELVERVVHVEEEGKEVDVAGVFDRLFRGKRSVLGKVWLDGVSPNAATTSSMAIPSFLITYSVKARSATLITIQASGWQRKTINLPSSTSFWDWFAEGQAELKATLMSKPEETAPQGRQGVSWRGGWVGWWGYEMKAESLGGYRMPHVPIRNGHNGEGGSWSDELDGEDVDACWAWCDRILQRRADGNWVARGIVTGDLPCFGTSAMLAALVEAGIDLGVSPDIWNSWTDAVSGEFTSGKGFRLDVPDVPMPAFRPDCTAENYQAGIQRCRESIYAGDSYELTLTTTFSAEPPRSDPDGFALYTKLRWRNPAPYSSYLHFPCIGKSCLSSSPERFLRIDSAGNIEMKPIKGTRARAKCLCTGGGDCKGPGGNLCTAKIAIRDAAIGESLRNDGKERAENLMIVDLIRSDLQSCCISSSVQVPKLIALETYETVHQLVTTVIGKLEDGVGEIQAVKRCFPPGSMTGAPKLRSVQILDELEGHQPRGIYSGAMGYMSVDGAVDLSVVIRTITMEGLPELNGTGGADESSTELGPGINARGTSERTMRIGAGGAITWLSDPQKEWDEVLTKVRSVTGKQIAD